MGNSNSSEKSVKATESVLIDMLLNDDEKHESFMGKEGKYDFILNLLLVKYDARKAYLFEAANFSISEENREKDISSFLKIISSLGLHYDLDPQSIDYPYPRYFVSKEKLKNVPDDDEQIGQLLGFKDPGGDFFNYRNKRISVRISEVISGVEIMVEILSPHRNIDDIDVLEHAREKVNSFNRVMHYLKLPYHFKYEIQQQDGTIKRLEELKKMNLKYLNENSYYYIEYDLENALAADDEPQKHPIVSIFKECLKDKNLLRKYLPLFEYMYDLFNNIEEYNHQRRLNLINKFCINLLLKNC